MAFCINCGEELNDGAKFCHVCGAAVNGNQTQQKREQEYAGKLIKCPNCGEVLNSFTAHCPTCGLELRGAKASNAVREFALKLEAIENGRRYERHQSWQDSILNISKTDEQKVNLIQNFAIPNTKEDILEFMILATANIDTSVFGTTSNKKSEKAIADAWFSKVKQAYTKAHSSYANDADFPRIENLYNNCVRDIKKQKRKQAVKNILLFGWMPILFILVFGISAILEPGIIREEETRLNDIVAEIELALENGEYKLALLNAQSLEYHASINNQDKETYWNVQREYWIDKIIAEADAHGVKLNYALEDDAESTSPEPEETEFKGGFFTGFFQGVLNGFQSGVNTVN